MNPHRNKKFAGSQSEGPLPYNLKNFSRQLVRLFCAQHLENAKFMDMPHGDPEKGYQYLCYASTSDITPYIPGEKVIPCDSSLAQFEKKAEDTTQANLRILANCLRFLSDPPDPAVAVAPFPNLSIQVEARADTGSPHFDEKRLLGFYLIIRIAESVERLRAPSNLHRFIPENRGFDASTATL
jgi:hypothetical protein